MSGLHAVLAPSKASRWIACPPSARIEEKLPEVESEYAAEGTLAHELGELLIAYKLGRIIQKKYKAALALIKENPLYNSEMWGHCEDYAFYVIERFNEAVAANPFSLLELETKLDLSAWAPECFGRLDTLIVSEPILEITDLKYGKGVPVYAEDNSQLKVYALGALDLFLGLYDIKTVRMNIYQPRLKNISSWEISVEDLITWGNNVVKPKGTIAFKGEGDFLPGSHCKFCKFGNMVNGCKALAEYYLEAAKEEFDDPRTLSDADMVKLLDRKDGLVKWVDKMEEYALLESLRHGKVWPGYKIVRGISRSTILEDKVIPVLVAKKYNEEDYLNKKLKSQADLRETFGTKLFYQLFDPYKITPPGKPVLVPLADKREAIDSIASARNDFPD